MLPYFPQPSFRLGPFVVHAFGVMALIAVLTSGWIIVRRGRRMGFPAEDMFRFWFCMYVCAMLGAHLFRTMLDDFPAFLADPTRAFRPMGISSIGAGSIGFLGGFLWCRFRRLSLFDSLRLLDIVAYALPFAWVFGRLGCTLAHDHRGRASMSWIAVNFPEGPRYDLGLIEFVLLIGMAIVFLIVDRQPHQAGFFTGLAGVAYGGIRILVAAFTGEPTRFYGGAASVLIGLLIWTAMLVLQRPDNDQFNRLAPAKNG
jgi:phosphatidylglycerol:prolipoprotein diacylglycerol transferase